MTTEEIEKAAEKEYLANPDYSVKELVNTFIAGAKFANKIWQEKTRWIPIEERLPKVRENEYPVYAKNERKKNDYAILVIEDSISIHYLKKAFTHWKEIEL